MADETSSGSTGGSSLGDGLLETAEGALEATGHFIERTAEDGAAAFEAAGATAADAAKLVETDASMVPGVSEVLSVGETAYHAGAAVGSAITGDWDGAADESLKMSESAANAATFGIAGLLEGAYDLGNAAGGGGESTDAHHEIASGLKAAGDWLGDEAYSLVHGNGPAATASPASSPDAGSADGGDAGQPAGAGPGEAGAYESYGTGYSDGS